MFERRVKLLPFENVKVEFFVMISDINFKDKILEQIKNNWASNLGKKIRTIQPHFEKHGSYKKKSVMLRLTPY